MAAEQKPIGMRLSEVPRKGIFVSEVEPDGNACAAGIRVGDRVIKTSCAPGFQSVRLPSYAPRAASPPLYPSRSPLSLSRCTVGARHGCF